MSKENTARDLTTNCHRPATSKNDGEKIPMHDSPGVIQIKDDRERRDGPGGEDGE